MPSVLYVLGGALDVGGAENQLVVIARALQERGYRVSVLCLWRRGSQADALERDGVPVYVLPRRLGYMRGPFAKLARFVGGLWMVQRCVRRERPQVVHFVLPHAYLVGGLATLFARKAVLVMGRRGLNRYLHGRPLTRWIEHRLHRRMHALMGNACRVAGELSAEGAPVERLGMIYNGVADERLVNLPTRHQARAELGIAKHQLVLVKVANLWTYKGHADLLAALATARLDADWCLLLVGREQGAGAALRRQAEQLGLDDRVSFMGERDDVPRILAAADVGVCVSHEEGFSNAVLEYLAAGLPSVVTDVGGNREAVGEAGIVVAAADVQGIRQAIEAMGSAATRAALGEKAVVRAERFSMRQCIAEHDQLYRSLLEQGVVPQGLQALQRCMTGQATTGGQR